MKYKTVKDFFNEFKINPDAVVLNEEHNYFSEDAHEIHSITAVSQNEMYEIRIKTNKNIKVCGKLKDILKYKGNGKIESI